MQKKDLKLIADSIRILSIDAVQKANSGHPGMPMGCADIAAVLWAEIMKYNPADPKWINRDRFVLSAGHGSMLLYSALHLSGYDISIDDIKNFRQLGSIAPGHPEFNCTPGVETTAGPLGQGFANGIGMSMASKLLGGEFNTDENKIIDHYIYAIVSDGDMMEGITSEAASLAGHMGLGNIIYIYDDNSITIEGSADLAFSENVERRFKAYNWHTQKIDGHNYDEINRALKNAQGEKNKPSLILAKTTIARGCPSKENDASSHGSPLGDEAVLETRKFLKWKSEKPFDIPDKVYDLFEKRRAVLKKEYEKWTTAFKKVISGDIKKKWDMFFSKPDTGFLRTKMPKFDPEKKIATRAASGKTLECLFKEIPNLIGGSADLAPSNNTFVKGFSETGKNKTGRNMHFGIREHAMGAIQNGVAYYGGFIPYSATFLAFLDYMRPSVRLSAISRLNSIFVYTHDSIFVGEDGPTHQPVEQLASARIIPNLTVIRPADAEETSEAWLSAIENGPAAIILTRQPVPIIKKTVKGASELAKGAYIIYESGPSIDLIIFASGSEVHLAVESAKKLNENNINSRVISFPSWELFEKQSEEYKSGIIPENIAKRVVVESGLSIGWQKYAGNNALFITMEKFGESAPYQVLAEKSGFAVEKITARIIDYFNK